MRDVIRLEAINDPRNAIAFLIAAMVVSKKSQKAAAKAVKKPVTVGAKLARKPTKNANRRPKHVKQHHVLVADGPIDRAQLLRAAGLSTNAGRVRGPRT